MKRTLNRSIFVMILAVAFVGGLLWFTVQIFFNADDWIQQSFNGHISGSGGLSQAGKILDRKGDILAQTIDGDRYYHENYNTRLATLHVVGDNSLNISTAVQSMYRSDLTGFSYIWGLGLPPSLRSSRDVTLTIDSDVCTQVYEKLGDRKGAAVVYNYKTGEILCSVSTATYDPQDPPKITEENEDQYAGAYVDRVLSGQYPPGSTFKLITAAAAIENIPNIYERTFRCNHGVVIGNSEITCLSDHGEINFKNGLAYSCNVVFAVLADELGNEIMEETARKMGFTKSFDVSGIPTAAGKFDLSKATDNDRGWSGIGQYTDIANPMQMAIMCGTIANGGTTVLPTEIKNVSSYFGLPGFDVKGKEQESQISSSLAEQLDDMMRYTITTSYGDDLFPSLTMCAKTGTAEVGEGKEPHAWMVGYSQDEDAPLAFAVVVENGGYGFSAAGPIAITAMEACAAVIRGQ